MISTTSPKTLFQIPGFKNLASNNWLQMPGLKHLGSKTCIQIPTRFYGKSTAEHHPQQPHGKSTPKPSHLNQNHNKQEQKRFSLTAKRVVFLQKNN